MAEYVLGFDIGGTMIKGGLFDASGAMVSSDEIPTRADEGQARVVDAIAALAGSLQSAAARAAALGIGMAGLIDTGREVLLASPNLPQLNGLPLKRILEERLGVPVCLENDANAAALGELWAGKGRGHGSFMLVTLGTGVGSGLVLDGKLWTGETGKAAEFGHVCVVPGGRACGCGKKGCIEAYSSGSAIVQMAREALGRGEPTHLSSAYGTQPEKLTPKALYDAAVRGDALCLGIFHAAARYLGIALAGVNSLLDIHTFILGGGVSQAAPVFGVTLLESLREQVFAESRDRIRVIVSKLGNDAGICGAGFLALQHARRR